MVLEELLRGLEYATSLKGIEAIEIKNVITDSRLLKEGDIFICIAGARFDGHEFAKKELALKEVIVVVEKDLGFDHQIMVKDTRKAYAVIAANFCGNPADKLNLIGVTGTNGKTSITYIIKQLLESLGHKTGLIGTIQNEIEDMSFPAKYTTPGPMELNILFKKMLEAGCEYVVMEISSHALDQDRVYELNFEIAIFTNLTQDHLDYHGNMENYFDAKKRLFSMCKNAVINVDDDYGKRLYNEIKCKKYSYAVNNEADFVGKNILVSSTGTQFKLESKFGDYEIKILMLGKFFVANTIASIVAVNILEFDIKEILLKLGECKGVKGRAEILPIETNFTIIRDYAHGPDGIEKILDAVNEFATGRVVILFGCAGNRDRTKREKMAQIAAKKSDYVILTSDNPRDEDPELIISDARPGLEKNETPYTIIVDRYEAIEWAINNAEENDILVLAGKGHEDYQVLDYGTVYFDEYRIVSDIINKKKKK